MQNIKPAMPARTMQTAITICLIIALAGCKWPTPLTDNEVVMCEGMQIQVADDQRITITAIDSVTRNYKIDSFDINARLIPRPERWYGSLGLYKPTGTGDLHMVLEEGQQHFHSTTEAMDWLELAQRPIGIHIKYAQDGLVIAWAHDQNVLRVALWQIYIQGNKPTKLEDASMPGLISVTIPEEQTSNCTTTGRFTPSAPEIINGRLFSGRSLDLMKERGISAESIEAVISHSRSSRSGDYTIHLNNESFTKPSAVIVNASGAVVSII